MSKWWTRWALGTSILIVAIWLLIGRSSAPEEAAQDSEHSAQVSAGINRMAAPQPAAPQPEAAPPTVQVPAIEATPESLQLVAHLLPRRGTPPPDRALIGVGTISEGDLYEYGLWLGEGGTGPGPARVEELANFHTWLDAPLTPTDDGHRVGPIEVPEAAAYVVLAWNDEMHHWLKRHEPGPIILADGLIDAGVVEPTRPTGLNIQLVNNSVGDRTYFVMLSRVVADDAASHGAIPRDGRPTMPLLIHAAPEVLAAYREETPLVLNADRSTELLPLLPDGAVRLWLRTFSGIESSELVVPLDAESIKTITIDIGELFGDIDGAFVDLRGRLISSRSKQPIAGARIERFGGGNHTRNEAITDDDGRFNFEILPMHAPTRFRVVAREPEDQIVGRPATVDSAWFDVLPAEHDVTKDLTIEVEWEMPAFQWLIGRIPEALQRQISERARPPHPIYALERFDDETGSFRATRAQEFIPEKNAIAVSIQRPGLYRLQLMMTPLQSITSIPVEITEEDEEVTTEWDASTIAAGRILRIRVLDEERRPIGGAQISAFGGDAAIPALSLESDRSGNAVLDEVTTDRLTIYAVDPAGREAERILDLTTFVESTVELILK